MHYFVFTEKMFKTLISAVATTSVFLSCIEARPLNSTSTANITSPQRGIISTACTPRTTRELEIQLQTHGSFNKRYQAITRDAAAKFPNLLNQTAPNTTTTSRPTSPFPKTNLTSVRTKGSSDQNGHRRLCTEWSAVTVLSPAYFPRYLNEIICDTNDRSCLSNKGQCNQGGVIVDILYDTGKCGFDGKQIWQVVNQWIRSCCDCMSLVWPLWRQLSL